MIQVEAFGRKLWVGDLDGSPVYYTADRRLIWTPVKVELADVQAALYIYGKRQEKEVA